MALPAARGAIYSNWLGFLYSKETARKLFFLLQRHFHLTSGFSDTFTVNTLPFKCLDEPFCFCLFSTLQIHTDDIEYNLNRDEDKRKTSRSELRVQTFDPQCTFKVSTCSFSW